VCVYQSFAAVPGTNVYDVCGLRLNGGLPLLMRVVLVIKGRREGKLLMQSSTRRNWLVTTSYLFPGPN
jgi:hypothetical protein